MPRMKPVKRIGDIPVFPMFRPVESGVHVPDTIYICQDDHNGIAFVSEEGKRKYLKMLWNCNQKEKASETELLRRKENRSRRNKK